MTTEHFQAQSAQLRIEIERREAEIARLQNDLTELEREVTEFRTHYERIVGMASRRLEAVKAAIDELMEQRRRGMIGTYDPQPTWTPPQGYVSVEEQYRRTWQAPSREAPNPPRSESERTADLKRMYRDLVRRFHPDLTADAAERIHRTEIMRHINEAYAAQDFETLEVLTVQTELPDDVPLAALTVRHLQKTLNELLDQVNGLKREHDMLFYGEMMRLKLEEKLARMRGRDLLREMVQQMNEDYYLLLERLDELRRNSGR